MIRSEVRDGVAIVTLERTARHNSLIPEMLSELIEHLEQVALDGRPIVLTGAGRAFCSGADLKWLATHHDPALGVADRVALHHSAILALLELRSPVIAAINGAVAGGGLGLALAADYRIAAEGASFTAAYFRLGLTPDGGSSAFLERSIGVARTLELLLTNRTLSAAEALAWHLINEVVADDVLLERAVAFARDLPAVPGYALLQTRRLLDMTGIRHQLQLESVAIRTAARGPVFRAALKAFLEAHPVTSVPHS
jgi:2-(1,2-epoxy-1,2-dihydrophenyl)acetyl-CoA isomerase